MALGVAVLVVSVMIYSGFRQEIEKKMASVGGHVSVRQFTTGSLYEEKPLDRNAAFLKKIRNTNGVAHIQSFAFKPALLRTDGEVEGVIIKGIGSDFNFSAFASNLEKPVNTPPAEEALWMSRTMAGKLGLQPGSEVVLFFMQDPPRFRKMKVTTLFETGLEEVDQNVVLVNQALVQSMNDWKPEQVGGFEVFVKDFAKFDAVLPSIEAALPYTLAAEPITQTQMQLFEWLKVIGRNVLVMFVLVALVSGFNMAATILIMVMERRRMVGILKAMGAGNRLVRSIFYQNGFRIIVQGLAWGNTIGLGFAWLQYHFHLLPLDPANYYLSTVPIAWDWPMMVGINVGVLAITALTILIPVRLVNRIQPGEAVRAV